jgi:N-acetylmuramoyl-L-alanine amidase-like protein
MPPKYTLRKKTTHIAIHCSATDPSQDNVDVKEIRKWHVNERGWIDIGYHGVILRDGTWQDGRPIDVMGAHVENNNATSIGICMVGGGKDKENNEFTVEQWTTLNTYVRRFLNLYPDCEVLGHRDFPGVNKYCPSFDVKTWWALMNARAYRA